MSAITMTRDGVTQVFSKHSLEACKAQGWRVLDRCDPRLTNPDGTLTQAGVNFLALLAREHPGLVLAAL